MQVHVLAKSAWGPQLPTSIVLATTYGELNPGSSQVQIDPWNLSAHPMVVPVKVVVRVILANHVPLVAIPMGTSEESAHGP